MNRLRTAVPLILAAAGAAIIALSGATASPGAPAAISRAAAPPAAASVTRPHGAGQPARRALTAAPAAAVRVLEEPVTAPPCANPLRSVASLTAERIDQGVDYAGTGPVYAICPGEVVATWNSGWPGGGWIVIRLTAGRYAGWYSYTAENITATVSIGQHVTSSTVIGTMNGGIETGWAQPPGTGNSLAMASGQWAGGATGYGRMYSEFLASLDAPPGIG